LKKQTREENWELKGQLLILASNVLTGFNTMDDAKSEGKEAIKAQREMDETTKAKYT
jgi:hypothetical protein